MNILKTKYNFWLYKSKLNKKGQSPIYMRIIVGPNKTEISTGIFVSVKNWDGNRQVVRDREEDAEVLNEKLEILKKKFKQSFKQLMELEIDFTPEMVKNKILGENIEFKTLLQLFNNHNAKMKELEGKDYAVATLKRYNTTLTHVINFLKHKFNQSDILISQLNLSFLNEFEYYFKTVRGCNHNSAIKYIKNLRRVINSALDNQQISKDPFVGYKSKIKPVTMDFLTKDELSRIENKNFDIPRLEGVRKIFLFQVYSGLSYIDIKNLKSSHIINLLDQQWIFTTRTKSKIPVRVPLISKAKDLLNASLIKDTNYIFNVPSNQKMNSYLKEIADLCGIKKRLSTHTARRTFATTVTLTNGVSIDAVSAMLGHTKISTTQLYAKVVPEKILNEMSKMIK